MEGMRPGPPWTAGALMLVPALLAACGKADPRDRPGRQEADPPSEPDAVAETCRPDEQLLFHCRTDDRKRLSLCLRDPPAPGGRIRYRIEGFGVAAASPAQVGVLDHDQVRLSSTGYAGGGEARIRFALGGVGYTVFDRTIRTGFDPEEGNDPEFSAGVIVIDAEGDTATYSCSNLASIHAAAYRALPREDFVDLP